MLAIVEVVPEQTGATIPAAPVPLGEISEATLRQLLDAAPDALIVVDQTGRIVMVNLQVERFFGYQRQDLLGQKIEYLIPERFRRAHPGHRSAFFDQHNGRTMGAGMDLYALRKDGTEFAVEISLSPLETEQGRLVSCAIRDVTARKIAEEEIFHLMVNNIKDYGIFMLDPEGRVVTWNAGAHAINGFQADEVVGKHFSLFYTASDIGDRRPEHALAAAGSTGRFTEEGWRVRKDGTPFWAKVVLTALRDPSEKLLGFAKVIFDMSERRRAQALDAAKTADLIAANRELEAFAYSVSHDLRAPLRHLDGFAELLRKNCYRQMDAQGQRYLDKITNSAQRMGRLIDDLLAFSRLLRADVSQTKVSLQLIQEEVRRELEPDLAGRAVAWIVGDLPAISMRATARSRMPWSNTSNRPLP
jgi:PAS domain S-box-containing protein